MWKRSSKGWLSVPVPFQSRPDFPGRNERARWVRAIREKHRFNCQMRQDAPSSSSDRQKSKRICCPIASTFLEGAGFCTANIPFPQIKTPEKEEPRSFLSELPNYLTDQEVLPLEGGVNTNRRLRSFVCSCRCARSLCIQAQTCLPNRP